MSHGPLLDAVREDRMLALTDGLFDNGVTGCIAACVKMKSMALSLMSSVGVMGDFRGDIGRVHGRKLMPVSVHRSRVFLRFQVFENMPHRT